MTNEVEHYIDNIEYVVYSNNETDIIIRWVVITLKNKLVLTGTPRINKLSLDNPTENERVAYLNGVLSVNEYFRCLETTLEAEELIVK